MAAIDYFLKLDGITGESADSKHKGEIEVLSFSFGETQMRPHRRPAAAAAPARSR